MQENEVYNPFGYRGEYTDSESGLIYLRARMYDAESARFINKDPIKDGTNWYIYCNGNPILFVDLFCLAPTEKEVAYISAHIYDYNQDSSKEKRIVEGWRLIDVWCGREGVKMDFYIPNEDDWKNPSEYVIAFKGTTLTNLGDWKNNAEQLLSSKSADMWDSINYAIAFVNEKST